MQPTQTDVISGIRARMILDHPWFATLAMRLRTEEDSSIQTLCTDGTTLRYNPTFLESLPPAQKIGVVAHETLHCALKHMYRRGGRDPQRWNEATDYVVNDILIKAGLELPSGVLADAQYSGMSAAQVYALRQQDQDQDQEQGQDQGQDDQQQNQQQGQQQSEGDQQQQGAGDTDCPTGSFTDPSPEDPTDPEASEQQMTEADWDIAAEQAARVSEKAGKMAAGAKRALVQSRESQEDWRAILREFIEHNLPSDYSWSTPNRRHIHAGLYLPGTYKENFGELVVAVDTSGSIGPAELEVFASEVRAIIGECRPERTTVIYCDSSINAVETFDQNDYLEMTPHGGGGTRFAPVFEHIESIDEVAPNVLVYLTDLCGPTDDLEEPEYPVLWVTPERSYRKGPFGTTTRLSQWS